MLPAPDGGRSPVWDAIGYPGPARQARRRRRLRRSSRSRSTATRTLDCDVCIVGSGAGGGTAAGVLAAAGLDVVVLEARRLLRRRRLRRRRADGATRIYLNAPAGRAHDQSVSLLAGSCLGGGTVVNYTTSFRTPDDVREEWAGHGVPGFAGDEYTRSLDAVCERLGVNQEHNTPSRREQILRAACVALGWHVDSMPRNVARLRPGQGLRLLRLRLPPRREAVDRRRPGSRTRTAPARACSSTTRAERVIVEGGAARGVEAAHADGHRVTVRSRAVVAACGALHTPALLRRSGLDEPEHRQAPAAASGDRRLGRVRRGGPAVGGHDAGALLRRAPLPRRRLRRQVRDRRRSTRTCWSPFLAVARRARPPEIMEALPHTVPIGVLLRDRDGGEVHVGRDGQPVVTLPRSPTTTRATCAPGSTAPHRSSRRPARSGSSPRSSAGSPTSPARAATGRAQFMRDADACGYGPGPLQLGSFHIMGSARMGGSPATLGLQPERRDLGRARPLRLRRLGFPDRLRRQPDDLDRGDRPHERARARSAAGLGPVCPANDGGRSWGRRRSVAAQLACFKRTAVEKRRGSCPVSARSWCQRMRQPGLDRGLQPPHEQARDPPGPWFVSISAD